MAAKALESAQASAWVDEKPVSFDVAVQEAARLIGASAAPVFAHLGTDAEGAREAILLAEKVGAVLDHAASGAMLSDLDVMRESGAMLTTPLEAATRADVVWLIGDAVFEAWPDLEARLLARPLQPPTEAAAQRVVWTRASVSESAALAGATIAASGSGVDRLVYLANLRASAKRPAAEGVAGILQATKFGVAIWSAAELEPLAIEAINGLVRDLNETTRFSTLPLAPPDNGAGVQTVCGWTTGFPLRTGFARGRPEHDPWRYDSRRLIAANEADCLIWVSAFEGGAAPQGPVDVALCAKGTARVRFDVARPGLDHDAILHDARVGALVAHKAAAPTARPTVAAILSAIRAKLGGAPC